MVSTRARRKDGRGSLKAKDKGAAAAETTPAKSKAPAAKPAAAATAGKKGKKGKGKGKEKEKVKVKGKGKAEAKVVVEEKVALVEEEVAQRVAFTRAPRRALSCLGAVSTEPLVPTGTADPGLHAGKVVSGRWWKAEHKSRHSNTKRKTGKSRYDKRKQAESKLKDLKEYNAEMIEGASARKQAEREKLEKRQQLRVDNQRKSEIVQIVTNTAKLKKLNRKQLRQYEKR